MARHLVTAQDEIARWASRPPKARAHGVSDARLDKALDATTVCIAQGDWSEATAINFLALYVLMHRKVYDVDPVMTAKERHECLLCIGSFVKKHFEDSPSDLACYIRWVWKREFDREKWAQTNGRQRGVMSWRLMLSTAVLTDYRVERARGH